jgi:hypothetical protein
VNEGHETDGPGVTATTVTIGVTYYQSAKGANDALGASNIDTGDPIAAVHVLIDAMNRSGGIAGRKVKAVSFSVDPQSTQPYAAAAQAMCSYFTQDVKVLAVISGTPAVDANECLARKGVAVLSGSLLPSHLAPNEVGVYSLAMARGYAALVPELAHQGWFGGWDRLRAAPGPAHAKTGVVTTSDPYTTKVIDGVLLPALRAAGYPADPSDVIRINPPGGFADDGAVVASIQNAVLKLNADGVDHVILDDSNGSLSLQFHNYANSQSYFPRYGGTSGTGWQTLLTAGDIQAKTLHGAIGIGWQPLLDLPYDGRDGAAPSAARRRCFQLFRAAGRPHTDAATATGQAEACDVALLLPIAFRGWTGPVNLQTILARSVALGTGYPMASGFSARFAAGQLDGTGAYRAMRFTDSCTCIRYVGRVVTL